MPSITDGDRFISGAVITSEDVELLDGDPETLNAHLPAKGVIRAHSITPVNMNNRPKDNGWAQLMQHNRKGDYYFISFSLSLSLSLFPLHVLLLLLLLLLEKKIIKKEIEKEI